MWLSNYIDQIVVLKLPQLYCWLDWLYIKVFCVIVDDLSVHLSNLVYKRLNLLYQLTLGVAGTEVVGFFPLPPEHNSLFIVIISFHVVSGDREENGE